MALPRSTSSPPCMTSVFLLLFCTIFIPSCPLCSAPQIQCHRRAVTVAKRLCCAPCVLAGAGWNHPRPLWAAPDSPHRDHLWPAPHHTHSVPRDTQTPREVAESLVSESWANKKSKPHYLLDSFKYI